MKATACGQNVSNDLLWIIQLESNESSIQCLTDRLECYFVSRLFFSWGCDCSNAFYMRCIQHCSSVPIVCECHKVLLHLQSCLCCELQDMHKCIVMSSTVAVICTDHCSWHFTFTSHVHNTPLWPLFAMLFAGCLPSLVVRLNGPSCVTAHLCWKHLRWQCSFMCSAFPVFT